MLNKPISRRKFMKNSVNAISALALAGCSSRSIGAAKEDGLLLHLGFDEGSGAQVVDQSGTLPSAAVSAFFR